jgi:hypothetical protein
VEHGEVGVGAFLPADEEAAEAVEPGVCPFDHPAAGAEAGLALECLRLLAARADVRREAELGRQLVDLGEVVALVQAEPLRLLGGRLGPLDWPALDRRARELEVVQVRARRRDPERDALTLGEE